MNSTQASDQIYYCDFAPETELREFSFTRERGSTDIVARSFILMVAKFSTVYLAKVRCVRHVATFGVALDLYDVRQVEIDLEILRGLMSGQHPQVHLPGEGRVTSLSSLFPQVRELLLTSNRDLSPDYFTFTFFSPDSDIPVQFADGVTTGFRLFHRTVPVSGYYKNLQEQEILDLDIQSFIGGGVHYDPYGRCEYIVGDRQLLLYKVDRKALERCLGVDLVYNYVDDGRCVFVQYKCMGKDGRPYYHRSDRNLQSEMDRMNQISGLSACLNRGREMDDMRLCACAAFVKVCSRDVLPHHKVPCGAYFPMCVWSRLIASPSKRGIKVDERPHLTNDGFTECVRGGLIGTTYMETRYLQEVLGLLNKNGDPERVRLLFEERDRHKGGFMTTAE